jgi:hypothetical protein
MAHQHHHKCLYEPIQSNSHHQKRLPEDPVLYDSPTWSLPTRFSKQNVVSPHMLHVLPIPISLNLINLKYTRWKGPQVYCGTAVRAVTCLALCL